MIFLAAIPFLVTALASRQWALAYHLGVFGVFVALYVLVPGGFKANFTDGKTDAGSTDALYFAGVTHTTVGYSGEIYPRTWRARMLVLAHSLLVFLAIAQIIRL